MAEKTTQSISVPTANKDAVDEHLRTGGKLLGRSASVGAFYAEAARELLERDRQRLKELGLADKVVAALLDPHLDADLDEGSDD